MEYEKRMTTIFECAREHVWIKDILPVISKEFSQYDSETMIFFFNIQIDHTADTCEWKEYHKQNSFITVYFDQTNATNCSFDAGYGLIHSRSLSGNDIQCCLTEILYSLRE